MEKVDTNLLEEALSEIKALKTIISVQSEAEFLDLKETASFLKISISTMQKISANRLIPVYQPRNGKVYFKKAELIEYLNASRKHH
jgi:hypothetical protein